MADRNSAGYGVEPASDVGARRAPSAASDSKTQAHPIRRTMSEINRQRPSFALQPNFAMRQHRTYRVVLSV
jgi:hypothetical protein